MLGESLRILKIMATRIRISAWIFAIARMLQLIAGIDPYDQKQLKRRKQEVLKFLRHSLFRRPEAPIL